MMAMWGWEVEVEVEVEVEDMVAKLSVKFSFGRVRFVDGSERYVYLPDEEVSRSVMLSDSS